MKRSIVFAIFYLLPSVILAEGIEVGGGIRQRRGLLIWELCKEDYACSRLTYDNNFSMYEVYMLNSVGYLRMGLTMGWSGGSIPQPSMRDEDWFTPGYLAKDGPRVELYTLSFHDSPYGFDGDRKDNDAWSRTNLNTYSIMPWIEWLIGKHWKLIGQISYEYYYYRRYESLILTRWTVTYFDPDSHLAISRDYWRPGYAYDFGYFEVNVSELRAGVSYNRSSGPYKFYGQFLPLTGFIDSRDDHGLITSTTWKNHTIGGGFVINLGIGYSIGNSVELLGEWSARRIYTRGIGTVYGLRVIESTGILSTKYSGSDVGIKESSVGMKVIFYI
jgi:hypothetical protein